MSVIFSNIAEQTMGHDVTHGHLPFTDIIMAMRVMDDELGLSASSKELICLPIIFDVTMDAGSTATDISKMADMPYSSVVRYIKNYVKLGLITYDKLYDNDRQNYILLTEKGKSLKQKVISAIEDERTQDMLTFQHQAIEDAGTRGKRLESTAEPVNHSLQAEPVVAGKVEIGQVTIKVADSDDGDYRQKFESPKFKNTIKDALFNAKGPNVIRKRLKELAAADSDYVLTQVIRSVRRFHQDGAPNAWWRGVEIGIVGADESLRNFRDGLCQRIQMDGVWMLYNHGDNPSTSLPVAVQVDLKGKDFDDLIKRHINDLTNEEIAGIADVTFSIVMKDLKALLNDRQYQSARTRITKAIADFSRQLKEASAKHEHRITALAYERKRQQENIKANIAFANTPTLPQDERLGFVQRASEESKKVQNVEKEIRNESHTIAQLYELIQAQSKRLEQLESEKTKVKDDKKDG